MHIYMYRRCILLIKYIDQVIFSKKLKAKMCESGEGGWGGWGGGYSLKKVEWKGDGHLESSRIGNTFWTMVLATALLLISLLKIVVMLT